MDVTAHAMAFEVLIVRSAATFTPAMLKNPDRLEEIKPVRRLQQFTVQISTFSPIRGDHRLSTPSRPLTVAMSFENEFTVQ